MDLSNLILLNTYPSRCPSGLTECLKNSVLYSVFKLDISEATMKSYPNRYISWKCYKSKIKFRKMNYSTWSLIKFKFKRVELAGSLIYDLFKEYYTLQQKHIYQKIDKEYYCETYIVCLAYMNQGFQNDSKILFCSRFRALAHNS